MDFLELMGDDASAMVLMRLDDGADLVRASSVSNSWYQFVIRNSFLKKLCERMCPELSIFHHVIEESSSVGTSEGGPSSDSEWEVLEREHQVYSYLSHCLVSTKKEDCILKPIGASSTDNFPDESIKNTLKPSDRGETGPSYWSSKGETDPEVPEILTYKLKSSLCLVRGIQIQPFKAFFQFGHPIYSSKSVRFRMGYSRIGQETTDDVLTGQQYTDDNYIWTYVSPEFPMNQENALQSFKLPRPVICIGGIVQIELLGRVQRQALDGLFYLCVCHIKVIGRKLSPVLDLDNLHDTSTGPVLKYFSDARAHATSEVQESEAQMQSSWHAFTTRLGELSWNNTILNRLLVAMQNYDFGSDEELL